MTLFIKLIVKNDSLMRFPLSCMKFMEPKIGQKSALISVCTLFDCKMYQFKSKLRQFPHWLNVGKSKQKNWRAYWSWLLSVSFTGLNFRFTKHIRLKMILCNLMVGISVYVSRCGSMAGSSLILAVAADMQTR